MLASSLIVALLPLLALSMAQAHNLNPPHLRHRRLANAVRHITDGETTPHAIVTPRTNTGHAQAKKIIKKSVKKRGQQCRPRQTAAASSTSTSATTSSDAIWASSSASSDSETWSVSTTDGTDTWNNQAWAAQKTSSWSASVTTSSPSWAPTSTYSAAESQSTASWAAPSSGSSSSSGLLSVNDPTCGWCGSSDDQPNGSEDWLNCGLNGGGWTPPMVTVDQLIAADLSGEGVFAPCAPYIDKFNQYAAQYGLKGIMLASFAMQESTCNPGATGGNGEAGLMQLAHENCGSAPNGNCYDVDFNIQRAAQLFSGLISSNGGNVLTGRCQAQNNLDYLFQYTSGWMQGKNGYNMGQYFNLKHC
ncbi:hypothetical protein IAR55_005486 [Kwoniella newhampshirensis]|uniref:Transglycosylase SLT domain-containing protein n=1 Tax=Kwoniella newhampshirensis TaxID=1651941 RepID=A0AAW0YVM7_9TREE